MFKIKIYLVALISFLSFRGNSQTTSISGVINIYTPVTALQCNSVIVNSSSGFNAGDRVLLIQMKGATVDLTNTSAFGTILNYNNAGNYEFANVSSISGNTIYFAKALLRTYTISGLVQLIKVPQYVNATVTATLTCQPWNGSTGGVLVFEASGSVTMNSSINITGTGFKGGPCVVNGYVACSAMNYFYTLASLRAGAKGEGIIASTVTYEGGRGAYANGGGGGNDHNCGGAGGGNYSIGGGGGDQAQSGVSSCPTQAIAGIGGKSLIYSNTANKIFSGGGGGSAHQNNAEGTPGTSAGGILIIKAGTITPNGNNILVNGNDNLLVANRDGAGGGGAGGTVLLDILNYTATLGIQANGGKGGNSSYSPDPLGPGGGGAGGVLWVSGGSVSPNITFTSNGGQPGIAGNGLPRGAVAGQNGGSLTGLILQESTIATVPATISPNTTICAGSSTTLTATGGGTYSWNNGMSTSSISVSPSSSTSYTVNVIDLSGCSSAVSTTVTIVPAPSATITGVSTICQGQSATLTASGGTSYSWSNGATTNPLVVSPLSITTYSVTATNSCGSNIDSFTVYIGSPIVANINSNTTICTGSAVTLTATGGTTYQWNTGQTATSIVVTPTGTTNYSLTASNGFCAGTSTATVTVNINSSLTLSVNTTVCVGTSATLNAWGGTSYSWNTGSTSSSIVVTPSTATSYTVTSIDVNGCSASATTSVTPLSVINASIGGNTSLCPGQTATLTVTGGTSYNWSTGATVSTIIVTPTVASTYTVISVMGTCSDTDTVNISMINPPIANVTSATICSGTSTLLTVSGGGTYLWNTGQTSAVISVSPILNTSYSVVVSVNSCSDTAFSNVIVNPSPIAGISPNISILLGEVATLTALGGGTYTWNNGDTTATILVSPSSTAMYCVTVSDSNNCWDTACVMVIIEPCPDDAILYVPNAFSPNGDNENDELQLFYSLFTCITKFHIAIFNRWGEMIYESYEPNFKWNGTHSIGILKGTQTPATEVYAYLIDVENMNGKKFYKKGNVSLVR